MRNLGPYELLRFEILGEYSHKNGMRDWLIKIGISTEKPQDICVSVDQYNKMSAPSLSPQANDKKIVFLLSRTLELMIGRGLPGSLVDGTIVW